MSRLDATELVRRRSQSSLLEQRARDPVDAVTQLFGLQAQDIPAMRLAVRARVEGCAERDVRAAIGAPTLVRTWAMRGTLHLIPAADVRWLGRLLGPRLQADTAHRRRQLEIPDELCESALPFLKEVLAAGPLERAAIVAALAERGFHLTPGSQAVPHLLSYAAAAGVTCCGPEDTYVLVEGWVPESPKPPKDALAELARRYLAGHAPAAAEDFAAWSGLPLTQARKGFAAIDTELSWWDSDLGPMATLTTRSPKPVDSPAVRLLPRYDDYLLGWRDRELILDPAHRRAIHPGGGTLNAALTIDGIVRGTWRLQGRPGKHALHVTPFAAVTKAERSLIAREVTDIGRFLDEQVRAEIA
ncbi:MAG TPA: winged helix DNA-binding domain-containing protein [Frankiaceae bacterium]|nr:winged helix DNA-binding domain-containing protein [Frankiaceae bacterium]